jgi:prepilin peptidase CpaA
MPQLAPADVVVALVCLIALITDLRKQKIPNALTFPAMGLGVVWNLLMGDGWVGVIGAAVGFAVCFPAWLLKAIRAGDAKLIMAIGAFYGGGDALRCALLMYMLNLPFGLLVLVIKGRLRNLVPAIRAGFKQAMGQEVEQPPDLTVVAFSPVIVVALILTRATELLKWS